MKYFIVLLLLISCVEKKTNFPQHNKVEDKKIYKKRKFFKKEKIQIYDFDKLPLKKDLDYLSNKNTPDYNIDDLLKKRILKNDNYYKLIYYDKIFENDNFQTFTIFGNYDYYSDIILITLANDNKIIDYMKIASLMGDGNELLEIKTTFVDSLSFKTTILQKILTNKKYYKTIKAQSTLYKIQSDGKIVRTNFK